MVANTDDVYAYDTVWMTQSFSDSVVFNVWADSDVRVGLTEQVEDTQKGYEVGFGVDSNKLSFIKYMDRNTSALVIETQDILKSDRTTLWVSFKDGLIEMGTGGDVGARTLLSWRDNDNPIKVKAISFATGHSYKGTFLVDEFRGEYEEKLPHPIMYPRPYMYLELNGNNSWFKYIITTIIIYSLTLSTLTMH